MTTHPEPLVDLLYEEGPCLAVNKPSGLLTQAPPHIDSLEARIKAYLKQRDQKPGRVYLGVPHRLDRPVSGVLVFARHVRAARRLSEQFHGRLVDKIYWALLEGHVQDPSVSWYDYVRKIPDQAQAEIVPPSHPDARAAILNLTVVRYLERQTWVRVRLETGRTHQIRVQAAARHHPVVGDLLYGAGQSFGPPTTDDRARGIALHAREISLRHPMTRAPLTITAPLPAHWPGLDSPPDAS
jgi:23S rRNA pseudouridine1911/1915/1917 synthase